MKRDSDLGGLNKALEIGFANVPLGVDAEKFVFLSFPRFGVFS